MQVCTGTWRPVPDDAPVLAPTYASTYREWRRSYRFQVYWSEDSTGGTTTDPIVTPSSYVSYHVWEYRDWETRGYQRLGAPVPAIGLAMLVNADDNSSADSSVPALGNVRNSDAIPVEETFTYATPFSHGDRSTAAQLTSVLYGDTRDAQRGDLSFPSSERLRAVSRSPRRGGFFDQR